MTGVWIAVLGTMFVWWFSTGAILWRVKTADRNGGAAHMRSVVFGLPLLALGVWGFTATLGDESAIGAVLACLSALAIWGWIELSFLSGVITGPNPHKLRAGVPEWERFIRAWGTIAYHEILLAAALGLMLTIAWDAANAFGLWTYVVLFFARISAKLNLFLGVPRIHIDFLPRPLAHLPSHFRIRALNWLFPFSVTALTFAAACWLERLYAVETHGEVIGFALLATLTSLAVLEHWLMVLPVPDEKLWRWMMPSASPTPISPDTRLSEDPNGL